MSDITSISRTNISIAVDIDNEFYLYTPMDGNCVIICAFLAWKRRNVILDIDNHVSWTTTTI